MNFLAISASPVLVLYVYDTLNVSLSAVVVVDRVREYQKTKVGDGKVIVNNALNSTLSRTVNTSLTTIVVLLIIFVFGGEVIRGFMFALILGVIVGTYSSLFIATPVMVDTSKMKKIT